MKDRGRNGKHRKGSKQPHSALVVAHQPETDTHAPLSHMPLVGPDVVTPVQVSFWALVPEHAVEGPWLPRGGQ